MKLLNGKVLSDIVMANLKKEVEAMCEKDGRSISLVIIQVGDDEASSVYVKNKIKACGAIGIGCSVIRFHKDVSQEELYNQVVALNIDESITGILVQLPLPNHINEKEILSAISVSKDVDGFNEVNAGNLALGNECIAPCTAAGIIRLLKYSQIDISGKECVVVGRSNIVGKPVAMLLLKHDGTVTICHSKTKNLKSICKKADILVCAIGKPKFFNKEYIKDGAVVVDVGIHRQDNGKLCGDVDFDDVKDKVSAITPVPGGVGAMTVAMLMENCVRVASIGGDNH